MASSPHQKLYKKYQSRRSKVCQEEDDNSQEIDTIERWTLDKVHEDYWKVHYCGALVVKICRIEETFSSFRGICQHPDCDVYDPDLIHRNGQADWKRPQVQLTPHWDISSWKSVREIFKDIKETLSKYHEDWLRALRLEKLVRDVQDIKDETAL